MSGTANPKVAMRPFLPRDAPVVIEIFRASVDGLAADDYSEAQRAAWIAIADDEDAFKERLAKRLVLIGTMDGSSVGFASLDGADVIDMLYVHPVAAGHGVGSMLCDALERLAASRGAGSLTVDVSDNALQFFTRRGYAPQRRNSVPCGDEWLTNTTMQKKLPIKDKPS